MSDDVVRLFVYGTLMPGGYYYSRISSYVRRWQMAWCRGELANVEWYPALLKGEGLVRGVLLYCSRDVLPVADEIECYSPGATDNEYYREQVDVIRGEKTPRDCDETSTAWTYFYAKPEMLERRSRLVIGREGDVDLYGWQEKGKPDHDRLSS